MKGVKKGASNLDERQELNLLRAESASFWLLYFGLLVALLVQAIVGMSFASIAGEFVLLMLASVYVVAQCIRIGVWDRRLKPNLKTNLAVSALAGGTIFLFTGGMVLRNTEMRMPLISALCGLGSGVLTFGLCLGLLSLCAWSYRRRVEKLEAEDGED